MNENLVVNSWNWLLYHRWSKNCTLDWLLFVLVVWIVLSRVHLSGIALRWSRPVGISVAIWIGGSLRIILWLSRSGRGCLTLIGRRRLIAWWIGITLRLKDLRCWVGGWVGILIAWIVISFVTRRRLLVTDLLRIVQIMSRRMVHLYNSLQSKNL